LEPVIMVRSGRQKAILSPTPQRFGIPVHDRDFE
jgi:hypothetical protein